MHKSVVPNLDGRDGADKNEARLVEESSLWYRNVPRWKYIHVSELVYSDGAVKYKVRWQKYTVEENERISDETENFVFIWTEEEIKKKWGDGFLKVHPDVYRAAEITRKNQNDAAYILKLSTFGDLDTKEQVNTIANEIVQAYSNIIEVNKKKNSSSSPKKDEWIDIRNSNVYDSSKIREYFAALGGKSLEKERSFIVALTKELKDRWYKLRRSSSDYFFSSDPWRQKRWSIQLAPLTESDKLDDE